MGGTVGIVGLGIMGGAIARNLVERGWTVFGSDLDAGRRTELAAAGVEIADGAAVVARATPVVLTSLPSPAAAVAVATEIASSGAEPHIIVETSTLALTDKLRFRDIVEGAGHVALDCPLSGTGAQAKTRDLVVLASGDSAAIAKLRPLFSDFARSTEDVGVFGNGSRMKFVANLLVAIHNVAAAEAMVLAMKAGLDPDEVVRVIGAGAGTSRMFEVRAPMMAENRYEPATMRVSTWQKDMAVIGAFARELGCETPLFSASGPVYDEAIASGLSDQDTAAVCRVIEAKSGFRR
jgi:3-hydroxyisobutyrate dehydrogenase-like beta-hydroxyacid dehydrogenase